MTGVEFLTLALSEIHAARAGDVPSAEDLEQARLTCNLLLNLWNADARAVYTKKAVSFTFTPGLSPHTIGPSAATWAQTQRPERIEAAEVGLTNVSPTAYTPITLRDYRWYSAQSVPLLSNSFPTDLYYQKDWPNGSLYFWGVPSVAYSCRLWIWTVFAEIAQADLANDLSLPPGYLAALQFTLAEWLGPSFGQPVTGETKEKARLARALVFGENDDVPTIATADAGLMRGMPTTFNYRSRSES